MSTFDDPLDGDRGRARSGAEELVIASASETLRDQATQSSWPGLSRPITSS